MEEKLAELEGALARHGATPASRRRRGMTLIEVMIVIAIIMLLMGALTFGLSRAFGQAQSQTAALQIKQIEKDVMIYKIRSRKLPDSLSALYGSDEMPVDPWGNEYIFRKGGGKDGYDIISYGADGKEGGAGNDADIKLSEI